MNLKNILTPKTLAERMGVTEQTVFVWMKEGMPTIKLGKFRYIFEDSFVKWAKSLEKHQDDV